MPVICISLWWVVGYLLLGVVFLPSMMWLDYKQLQKVDQTGFFKALKKSAIHTGATKIIGYSLLSILLWPLGVWESLR